MLQKTNSDQNSIFITHTTTPNRNDLNPFFQNDLSDIIDEQPMSELPKVSISASSQKQRKQRNNSPQKIEGANQIDFFSSQKQGLNEMETQQAPISMLQSGKSKSMKQSLRPLQLNLNNISMISDQEKSQIGITMFTEEQPLQTQKQQQSQQNVTQNRKATTQSQKNQDTKSYKSNQVSANRSSYKEQNSPFQKYVQTSIQMGVIGENNQNSQQVNLTNNRLSGKQQDQTQHQPKGKLAKYNNLLKQFIQRKKLGGAKKKDSLTSLNPQDQIDRLSSLVNVKSKIKNIVVKAVQKWKEYSSSWVQSQLSENAYKIIGDKSYMTEKQLSESDGFSNSSISRRNNMIHRKMLSLYKENKRKMKSCFFQLLKKWKTIKTIDPSSTILLYWDIVHILCIVFNIYYLIIEWVTEINFTSYYGLPWIISIFVSLGIFGIDMILNFHKGFYHEGVCIYDKWRIAKFYLSKNFFFDLCAIIPLIVSINEFNGTVKILSVLILFKIQTAIYILSKYKDLYSTRSANNNTSPIIYLIKLALTILFVAHIFASFFLGLGIYISKLDLNYKTWIQQREITGEPWLIQYIFSFYWAVCTMTTVGYGDITPQNPFEAGYVIITMFIACGFFGYTFNSIGSMVQEIQNRSKEFNENNSVSNDLKLRIRKYFEFKRNINNKELSKNQENEIIEQLDDDLKDQVVSEIGIQKYKTIKKITNIFEPFSDKIKKGLHEISEEIVIRGEESKYFIVQANQTLDYYDLFIVTHGRAKIYMKNDEEELPESSGGGGFYDPLKSEILQYEKKESKVQPQIKPLYVLESNSVFGEISFFTSQQRQFSIKCDKNTKLLRVSQKLFLELVKENQGDFEIYCQIRDDMILNKNFKTIGSSCLACNQEGHDITKCKYIHYSLDKNHFMRKKLLQDKYEFENHSQKPIVYERKRNSKQKYSKFMKYNNSISDKAQNTISSTPQAKRTLKQTSFKSIPNLTTIISNNEDKNDYREQVNLEESDQVQEFKYYYPESNISCVLWKMIIQNLKKRKKIEQQQMLTEMSQTLKQNNVKQSNNSIFSNNMNAQKNTFLNIPTSSNNGIQPKVKFRSIRDIVASLRNIPKNSNQEE